MEREHWMKQTTSREVETTILRVRCMTCVAHSTGNARGAAAVCARTTLAHAIRARGLRAEPDRRQTTNIHHVHPPAPSPRLVRPRVIFHPALPQLCNLLFLLYCRSY